MGNRVGEVTSLGTEMTFFVLMAQAASIFKPIVFPISCSGYMAFEHDDQTPYVLMWS